MPHSINSAVSLPDPLGCNSCQHPECRKFAGPRQMECRAMAENACARNHQSSNDYFDTAIGAVNGGAR